MSPENVELVRRAIPPSGADMVERYCGGLPKDFDQTLYAPDFEVEFISKDGSLRPATHGLEGLARAWRQWLEPWESFYVEVERLIDAGNEVVVLAHNRGHTERGGGAVESESAAIWSVRKGKIVKVRFYLERAEALEAAGLRE
jgi:ketosteroid isomerase-like protein